MDSLTRCVALAVLIYAAAGASATPPDQGGAFFSIGGINTEKDGHKVEAEHGVIAISREGRKWETVFKGGMVTDGFNHANNNMIRGIAYGNGRYVAVGNPGAGILISDNGRDWRHLTKYKDRLDGFNVAFGGGVFLVARAGDMLRSEDGIKWQRIPTPIEGRRTFGDGGLGHMRQVVYGNGVFVCMGDNRIAATRDGRGYHHVQFHTEDGKSGRQSLLFGGGRFLWLRTTGHMTSTDGVTWTPFTIDADEDERMRLAHVVGACWDGSKFIAGGKDAIYESADGVKWTKKPASGYIRCIAAGNGVVVGRESVSNDGGRTWEPTSRGVPQREIVFLPLQWPIN